MQRRWAFTYNIALELPANLGDLAEALVASGNVYAVCQVEQAPTTGMYHYQGYVELERKQRLRGTKNAMRAAFEGYGYDVERVHLEPARGTAEQNKTYCTKEPRVAGPWESGVPIKQGQRTDLNEIANSIINKGLAATIEEMPAAYIQYGSGMRLLNQTVSRKRARDRLFRDVKVILVIGQAGCGKTRFVFDKEGPDLYDQEPGSTWFDGYDDQEAVLLDDFGGSSSGWRLDYLLRFLDRYRLRLPVKGSFTYLNAKRVYVTTNVHPFNWYGWKGRWEQYSALMRRFHETWVFEDELPVLLTRDAYINQVVCWPYGPIPGSKLGNYTVEASTHEMPGGEPPSIPNWIVEQ